MTAPTEAPVWDVADWVQRFEAVGGYITPGGGVGWYVFRRPEEERMEARRIYGEIENCHEREQAVYDYANTPEQVQRYFAALQTGGDA